VTHAVDRVQYLPGKQLFPGAGCFFPKTGKTAG